jgi:hypothetical protein
LRRLFAVLGALVLVGLALWLYGRAPSRYVLEQECARYQEDRVAELNRLSREIALFEAALARGEEPHPDLERVREQRERLYRAHRELSVRGWDILLLPEGAVRPAPEDYLVSGRFDPSRPTDPPALRRTMEIWIRPNGGLARTLFRLGLSP